MATIPASTHKLKLCFTSWACPDWTAAAIVDGMQTYGFEGVELSLGDGHAHGVELDSSVETLVDIRRQFDESHKAVACLATACHFNSPVSDEREANLEELKKILQIAEKLGAPYVRVFGGDVPEDCEVTGVIDFVAESLANISEYIEKNQLRARVLLETHDTFSHSRFVMEAMAQICSSRVGILWDVLEPIRVLEKVEDTFDVICDHVRHVHIHDYTFNEDRTELIATPLGEGIVPMARIVDLLKANSYRGYLSAEFEGQEVDADEILPVAAKFLENLIKGEEQE